MINMDDFSAKTVISFEMLFFMKRRDLIVSLGAKMIINVISLPFQFFTLQLLLLKAASG